MVTTNANSAKADRHGEARTVVLETYVAGTAYYEARRVRPGLRAGDPLVLRREPRNIHDELAIEVFTARGEKLGYVPRHENPPFARLMDRGHALFALVDYMNPNSDRHIGIQIFLG